MKHLQKPTLAFSSQTETFQEAQVHRKRPLFLSLSSEIKLTEPATDVNAKADAISKALETFARAISKSA